MSTFTALNLEPESDSEEEIDDTKEIQIEEALKLYQNALKLHSQGPLYYDAAQAAYDALLRSEIFTYPESLSESKRIELYGDAFLDDDDDEDALLPDSVAPAGGNDGAADALPQMLYLSYKNYGQFLLDRVTHNAKVAQQQRGVGGTFLQGDERTIASHAVALFAEAIERDDTDSDLWRRISRIGALLQSRRIPRFCLESVLKEQAGDLFPEPMDLDTAVARDELRDMIHTIDDSLSEFQIASLSDEKVVIPEGFKKLMDTCPDLPIPSLSIEPAVQHEMNIPVQTMPSHIRDWTSVGRVILQCLVMQKQGMVHPRFGSSYVITVPLNPPPGAPMVFNRPATPAVRPAVPAASTAAKGQLTTFSTVSEQNTLSGTTAAHDTERYKSDADAREVDQSISDQQQVLSPGPRGEAEDGVTKNESGRAKEDSGNVPPTAPLPSPKSMEFGNLPTRKRSVESAGLQDPGDGGRTKSKRIRARAEAPDEETSAAELAMFYEQRLEVYVQHDLWLFEHTNGLMSKLGHQGLGTLGELRHTIDISEESSRSPRDSDYGTAIRDFKNVLSLWDPEKSNIFLRAGGLEDSLEKLDGDKTSGLTLFLEYSKRGSQKPSAKPLLFGDIGLADFVNGVNQSWTCLESLALKWTTTLLCPRKLYPREEGQKSTYLDYLWPDNLKEQVVQILVAQDPYLFPLVNEQLEALESSLSSRHDTSYDASLVTQDKDIFELIQTSFEIHLDIHARITNPSSIVDQNARTGQRDRLRRWATLANRAMTIFKMLYPTDLPAEHLYLRYLWATVLHLNLTEEASREHVILCLEDLEKTLRSIGRPVIELQNNAIMPEVSFQAAEREISRLKTMDFFLRIFDQDTNDPLVIIESLEPVLFESYAAKDQDRQQREGATESNGSSAGSMNGLQPDEANTENVEQNVQMEQMIDFLHKANTSLKLFLWRRLRTAYKAIKYPPMVFLCNVRSLELILKELRSAAYTNESSESRLSSLVGWIRSLDELITSSLDLSINEKSAFDCMDEHNLQTTIESCVQLTKVLHVVALWEDAVRVGQVQAPQQPPGPASTSYNAAMMRLRSLHMRSWVLLYTVLKEAMMQNAGLFTTPKEDQADYLRFLHNTLGWRQYCNLSKKLFLRFMKDELSLFKASENWESDMAQVIFDLYGLRLCSNVQLLEDHGCLPDAVDKASAIGLVEYAMKQARNISIKDLIKTEMKPSIDKLQSVIGQPKVSSSQWFNRRLINIYLKSPINPIDLYRCLKGIPSLPAKVIKTDHAKIVRHGWYFVLGHITLAKYKAQKRAPSPTDDLEVAIAFFKLDLEYDPEKWETWYRFAQVYDAWLDEETTWNAEKLNGNRLDLINLQRNAIHCYTMAVSVAIRSADSTFETASKMSDLFSDFGNRIYASTREPFSMEVFSLNDYTRHFNGEYRGMYKQRPFRDLQMYPAWVFASVLFRQALVDKPRRWTNWYMLAKCLWKLYCYRQGSHVDYTEVLDALTRAIECIPQKRDNRHPDKDLPILEPHYKLVSIVHKLVQRQKITTREGCQFLDATPYAQKIPHIQEQEDWEGYIISILKSLRAADKANWHHRMVARVAHVIYDDSSTDHMAALGAKYELTQQIFTKTMAIQVWKPENERPGRHFVYTSRYVEFFVRLLRQTRDWATLEALAKRIRKRAGDFLDHTRLWDTVCRACLDLLRVRGGIPIGQEDAVFKSVSHLTFLLNTGRLEEWTQSPEADTNYLQLLRDISELKKLNNNLMKGTMFNDLLGDAYAHLYNRVVPELIAKSTDEENRERMRVDHVLMNAEASPADTPSPLASGQGTDPTMIRKPKVITKAEIIRKAEALIIKLVAQPLPSVSKPPAVRPQTAAPPAMLSPTLPIQQPSEAASTHPPENPSADANATDTATLKPDNAPDKDKEKERELSSVAGSVHDSADDESELSEIEDMEEPADIAPKPLFPGLIKRVQAVERSDAESSKDEDGGDEQEEEEAEAEEEGEEEGEGGGEGEEEGEGEGDGEGGGEDDEGTAVENEEEKIEE